MHLTIYQAPIRLSIFIRHIKGTGWRSGGVKFLSWAYLLHAWRNFNETIEMFTTMRSIVARMNQVKRSKSLKNVCPEKIFTSTCIKGFQYNVAQMFTIVRRSVACKSSMFKVQRSMSQIGVKIQITIWKCAFGPFSHHLLRDWNSNGQYHDYGCEPCSLC
jgi:hypothetical protein